MVIPQIQYLTNDSWVEVSALDETNGWPMLHSASYGGGTLYVLTIPNSFTDLYHLPAAVLDRIRDTLCRDLFVRLHGPAMVSLFTYDNARSSWSPSATSRWTYRYGRRIRRPP